MNENTWNGNVRNKIIFSEKKSLDRQESPMNMLDGKVNDLEKIELEIIQGKKIEQIF